MDPTTTLSRLSDCIATQDFSGAVDALQDYYSWRLSGGFEPAGGDARAAILAARLAEALS